ncbi:zf-HC2 domain-containing protein [Kitasatospora sp. A2-31]|uniref:zf-HC2 domain-containing protein n=1 Tax=Kitasatospora sp. A2-31 TaxID=2916414 RepID=UPI001EEA58A7|nr:zf-HC2 domain-containing protein [Kitasatospora sp. A2-31]MCG6495886.1 zf-HC2 domain-containing protein [Kitasatospora sp. A2-31]
MRCAHFRTALSARLDGEPTGVPGRRLDKHVARCTACREWLQRAERLRGVVSAAGADGPSADWSAALFTRLGEADGVPGGGAAEDGAGEDGAAEDGAGGPGRPGQGDGRRDG